MALRNGPPPAMKWDATISDSTNDAATATMPISAPCFGIRLPKNTMRKKEANGRTAMIQLYRINAWGLLSPLQQVDLVDVDGLSVAVDQDHDGQADADLGRGHGDHEQREHLAGEQALLQELREGDQVDVDGVQHELD